MINQKQDYNHLHHSLQADLATGWKPKLKIIGPMPLNYDNPLVDKAVMALLYQQSSFYQVIYLGPRPTSTFKLQELIAKHYKYKYMYLLHNDFAHLRSFFKKFYSLFEPKVKRPFYGMNPNYNEKELLFNSCFQSGNLDCAIRVKKQQYDLILRVDSNSAGHILWYYFQVCNLQKRAKNVRFNIVNLRRNKSAYQRGMRPFVKRSDSPWKQEGTNVALTEERFCYQRQNFSFEQEDKGDKEENTFFRKFSFQIRMEANQNIQIAYSIPYTYSRLLEDIRLFKKKAESLPQISLDVDLSYESLSGLEIPLLKIKSKSQSGKGRYCAFIMARQHPGQANSSHVLKGTIQQLLSGSDISKAILNHCDFYILPMVNPDGVVGGNFRTSLFGKDLNRLFKAKDTILLPQIQMVKSILTQLSEAYKKRFMLFLDHHGHSTRRNCFVLGPGIFDANMLNDIRVLPKIMASYTQIFRYPSCSFRLQQNKKRTARALFGKISGLSYTIETSNWSFYQRSTGTIQDFNAEIWQSLGFNLMQGIESFLLSKIQAKNKYEKKTRDSAKMKLKIKDKKTFEPQIKTSKQINTLSSPKIRMKSKRAVTQIKITQNDNQQLTFQDFNPLQKIPQKVQEANESDQMSQNGMDTDSSNQDMEPTHFKQYIKAASEMLIEFEKVYYGDGFGKGLSKYNVQQKSTKVIKYKKKEATIQACLKYKILQPYKYDQEPKQMKNNLVNEQKLFRNNLGKAKSQIKLKMEPQKRKMRNFIQSYKQQKKDIEYLSIEQSHPREVFIFQRKEMVEIEKLKEKQRKKQLQSQPKRQLLLKSRIIQLHNKQISPNNILLPTIRGSKSSLTQDSPPNLPKTVTNKKQPLNSLISSYSLNTHSILNSLRKSRFNVQ